MVDCVVCSFLFPRASSLGKHGGANILNPKSYIASLSPGMKPWARRRKRWLVGQERLAMQGVAVDEIHDRNKEMPFVQSKMNQMAGEMVNLLSVSQYMLLVLANIDLK